MSTHFGSFLNAASVFAEAGVKDRNLSDFSSRLLIYYISLRSYVNSDVGCIIPFTDQETEA